jgi:hypothetical protein
LIGTPARRCTAFSVIGEGLLEANSIDRHAGETMHRAGRGPDSAGRLCVATQEHRNIQSRGRQSRQSKLRDNAGFATNNLCADPTLGLTLNVTGAGLVADVPNFRTAIVDANAATVTNNGTSSRRVPTRRSSGASLSARQR